MELKPGYKQTEVGPIPDDWELKTLHSVLSKGRLGGNYPNKDTESAFPLMKMGNLARGHFDMSKVEFITQGVIPEAQHRLICGDVLFNTRNTLELVGKVAIWRDELPAAYYNSNLMRLDFDPHEICSNEYANYALNTFGSIVRLRGLATGTTSVAAIYTRDLLKLPFVVPPKPEQLAIAEALSDVDGLIGALEKLITKKRAIKQATMQRLLTGRTRLPGFSGAWHDKPMDELVDVDPENLPSSTPVDYHFNYISLEQVDAGRLLAWTEERFATAPSRARRVLRHDDVLMSTVRPNLMAHLHYQSQIPNAVCSTGFAVLRSKPGRAIPAYIYAHLFAYGVNKQIEKMLAGSNYPAINGRDVKQINLPCPPDVDEQAAIAEVLFDMDAEIKALEERRDKTCEIKQGMMQQLLTGWVRLVNGEATA